jgi:hypothetical protein
MSGFGIFIKYFLRLMGGTALLALIFVAAPYSWMNFIHQYLGMGTLPAEPIVGYLARSTSAFYAMLGGLAILISINLLKYKIILRFLGLTTIIMGCALIAVDWLEGMPYYWKIAEGPLDTLLGVLFFVASYRLSDKKNH